VCYSLLRIVTGSWPIPDQWHVVRQVGPEVVDGPGQEDVGAEPHLQEEHVSHERVLDLLDQLTDVGVVNCRLDLLDLAPVFPCSQTKTSASARSVE
jgi:hypothetical protein